MNLRVKIRKIIKDQHLNKSYIDKEISLAVQ
jgi:hypothetical protein